MHTTAFFSLRPLLPSEQECLTTFWQEHWGAPLMVTRGVIHHARDLSAFVAEDPAGAWVGLLSYRVEGGACEVMSLDALREGQGIGTALLGAIVGLARAQRLARLWLITTNDNTRALRFYQRRGWRLAALYPGAVAAARALKPSIPLSGDDGIPICDEIELEYPLG